MILDNRGNPLPRKRFTIGFKPMEILDKPEPEPKSTQEMPPLEDVIGFLISEGVIIEDDAPEAP